MKWSHKIIFECITGSSFISLQYILNSQLSKTCSGKDHDPDPTKFIRYCIRSFSLRGRWTGNILSMYKLYLQYPAQIDGAKISSRRQSLHLHAQKWFYNPRPMQNRTGTEEQNDLPKVVQQIKFSRRNKTVLSTTFSGSWSNLTCILPSDTSNIT